METQYFLRKLEDIELTVNRQQCSSNAFMTMKVSSHQLDLFANIDQLKSAIHAWKQTQPLLRSTVVSRKNNEFYFAIDETSSANTNLENVHFLRINPNPDSALAKILVDDQILVELVLEKCASELIDFEKHPNDLLWRLFIIELKKEPNDRFSYEFVWHINHAIADGVSMSRNLSLLLDLIHKSIKNRPIEPLNDFGVFVGRKKLFEKEQKLAEDKLIGSPLEMPRITKPNFLDPAKARNNSRTRFTESLLAGWSLDKLDQIQLVDLNRGQCCCLVTLGQLVRISHDVSNFKRNKFEISDETFENFLKK